MSEAVVWFRRDLRLGDNPAWNRACGRHRRVIPLFVIDPGLWERVTPARRSLLSAHLRALDTSLGKLGGSLRVEYGDPAEVVPALAARRPVYANADVTPYARRRDRTTGLLVEIRWSDGSLVHPPGSVMTRAGGVYTVFTPFYRTWRSREVTRPPTPGPCQVTRVPGGGIPNTAPPSLAVGEEAALRRLQSFSLRVSRYGEERDRPDLDATSRLSVDLKWGAISPVTVLHRLAPHGTLEEPAGTETGATGDSGRSGFVRQLAWRDFHSHLLAAHPHLTDHALKPAYDRIRWRDDPVGLEAWKEGVTGFPIVDAGMRQLLAEGWIHNRVRMIVASFLVKDLLIDWRLGERWFRRRLVDGDTAQNVGNWQWVAGCGADAAPYFRIFNPLTQSRRFDPNGVYIRRWVPELRQMTGRGIHAPWEVSPAHLSSAGVTLGRTYPFPILDHDMARDRTLATYREALSAPKG